MIANMTSNFEDSAVVLLYYPARQQRTVYDAFREMGMGRAGRVQSVFWTGLVLV